VPLHLLRGAVLSSAVLPKALPRQGVLPPEIACGRLIATETPTKPYRRALQQANEPELGMNLPENVPAVEGGR
jgi:hypothetical protein